MPWFMVRIAQPARSCIANFREKEIIMKTNKELFVVSKLTLAVQGALMVMLAMPLVSYAEDEAVAALTHPTNSVEIGAEYIPKDSAKFGEYNGLNKKGADLIGNFNIRGGDVYNAFDGGDGINRWEVKGNDLGTTSRELSGNVSNQGKWSMGIGYDELRHNITDSYQTPFQGSMGGNNFTLPTTFGVINTTNTVASGYKGSNTLTPAQLASFNTQDVHSDRDNTTFNVKYLFDSHWDVKFDFNHLKQSGAKLMGVAGDGTSTGGVNGTGQTLTWAGQTPIVLMNPTNYTTDNFNLALNWAGEQGYASASYVGSMFRDGYNSVLFDNPFVKNTVANGATGSVPTSFPVDAMSTMPSNDFNQLNLSGGYPFTSATKLVGGLSYGRNTQNDTYSTTGVMLGALPQGSLNGLVVTTHADLKLTNQTTKDLLLSAGLKYNERDNQTASNPYTWTDINQAAGQTETSMNAPMSNKKTQLEFAGDYRINKDQKLRLSYEYETINRWCNNAAANNAQGSFNTTVPSVTGVNAYYAATCAQVPDSKENKLAANYKLKATEDVSLSAGYAYSDRKADISPSFYNPMQAVNTPAGSGSNGEGFEVAGFMAYFQESRKEQLLKAGVNWQANEKLSIGLNGRYTDDKYDSTYGVQNGNSWSLNLDSTYSYGENGSVSAYVTTQNSSRDLTDLQNASTAATAASATALNVPIGATWTNKLKENDTTLGLGAKKGGLMGDKLDLTGDLTYSLGKTSYGTQFNYVSATAPVAPNPVLTCSSPQFLTCGDLPDIKNTMVQLKLVGSYKIDKASKVIMGYIYQHLNSSDYLYNAYQYGSTPSSMLPTNQQAPSYSVNVISAAYVHNF
jgi:MtrB/PioB family decaheme-associated outer membrane protein